MENITERIIQFRNSPTTRKLNEFYTTNSLMEIYNINRKEIRHTSFLTWLFNPANNIGESALRKLLDLIISSRFLDQTIINADLLNILTIGNYEFDYRKISENYSVKGGLVDLYIEVSINKMKIEIIIENKVYSNEHDDQTQKYYDYVLKNANETTHFFIYLTPLSSIKLDELIEPECFCKKYIQINYQQIVDNIIESLLFEGVDDTTKYILEDYLKALSTPVNTNQNKFKYMAISTKESELLTKFWEENKDLILKAVEATKDNTHIEQDKREVAKEISEILQKDQGEKIGAYVNRNMKELFVNGNITMDEIINFQDKGYSKENFGIQYPLLEKVINRNQAPKHYWNEIFTAGGVEFYMCNEWYENDKNNDRVLFEKWLKTKKATI